LLPNSTKIDYSLEDKAVIIIDDVLFTGRSVRSALDSLLNYGRPKQVELLILVNRLYARHLPIEPNYVGIEVDTFKNQVVLVEWKQNNFPENKIWLISKDEEN
jgi:pyrimidine operon attenuation protein/uracil phosphoribosyltransferase